MFARVRVASVCFSTETNRAIKEEEEERGSVMERVQITSCPKLLHHDINAEKTDLF